MYTTNPFQHNNYHPPPTIYGPSQLCVDPKFLQLPPNFPKAPKPQAPEPEPDCNLFSGHSISGRVQPFPSAEQNILARLNAPSQHTIETARRGLRLFAETDETLRISEFFPMGNMAHDLEQQMRAQSMSPPKTITPQRLEIYATSMPVKTPNRGFFTPPGNTMDYQVQKPVVPKMGFFPPPPLTNIKKNVQDQQLSSSPPATPVPQKRSADNNDSRIVKKASFEQAPVRTDQRVVKKTTGSADHKATARKVSHSYALNAGRALSISHRKPKNTPPLIAGQISPTEIARRLSLSTTFIRTVEKLCEKVLLENRDLLDLPMKATKSKDRLCEVFNGYVARGELGAVREEDGGLWVKEPENEEARWLMYHFVRNMRQVLHLAKDFGNLDEEEEGVPVKKVRREKREN